MLTSEETMTRCSKDVTFPTLGSKRPILRYTCKLRREAYRRPCYGDSFVQISFLFRVWVFQEDVLFTYGMALIWSSISRTPPRTNQSSRMFVMPFPPGGFQSSWEDGYTWAPPPKFQRSTILASGWSIWRLSVLAFSGFEVGKVVAKLELDMGPEMFPTEACVVCFFGLSSTSYAPSMWFTWIFTVLP